MNNVPAAAAAAMYLLTYPKLLHGAYLHAFSYTQRTQERTPEIKSCKNIFPPAST
jgi:hypothetical protein